MRARPLSSLVLVLVLAVFLARGDAQSATTITLPADFTDELVATVASPTALAFTPDGRLLITTQPGLLRVYQGGVLLDPAALDLSAITCTESERGLLGVAVDPGFAGNGFLYLYYTTDVTGTCVNRLSRFTMSGNTVAPGSEAVLLDNIPSYGGNHNGGDVHVGKDGYLYVSVGDGGCDYEVPHNCGGTNDAARDMHAPLGKVLRITLGGGIPPDNPYRGAGTVRCNTGTSTAPNVCQETFASGLRNPFRLAFDPNGSGTRFFVNDVGQNTWEEIDVGAAAADYGWNVREGPCARGSTTDCAPPPPGMTNPIYAYQQGQPSGCRAITGGAFVPNGTWPAEYDGSYLFADYVCGRIFRLDLVSGTYVRTDFATGLGSDSAVHLTFGPHAGTQALYYTTYEAGGSVRRIAYTGSANRAPVATGASVTTREDTPVTVPLAASDADGNTITRAISRGPARGSLGPIAGSQVAYAPAPDANGADSFEFTASDGAATSVPATVSVGVQTVNDPPVVRTDVIRATADGAVVVDVLANDTAGPADEAGQALRLAGVATPARGTASISGGRLLYRPSPTHNGPVTFGYTVCDDGQTAGLPDARCAAGTVDFAFVARRPVRLSAPRIVGGRRAGTVAVAQTGRWSAAPVPIAHRWLRCRASRCTRIAGAAGRRYRVRLGDVGRALRVLVTVRNRFGTATATSARTRTVATPVELAAVRQSGGDWVLLRNRVGARVSLAGWSLRDAAGNVHALGKVTIAPGRFLRVPTPGLWDARDRATLRLPGGRVADTCSFAAKSDVVRC